MKQLGYILGLLILLSSCSDDLPENPFDGASFNQDTVRLDLTEAEASSIAGIYNNVFQPTCANVGCHDGTFEPDFRTIESSFNTLVYQEPIKNDGNYEYRVQPGNPDASVLMARLNNIIGPIMPFQVEPDSDWPSKQQEYIGHIRTWIENGAPDIMGVVREPTYPAPVLLGAGAAIEGEWSARSGGTGPLLIPNDSIGQVSFYFAFRHDMIDAKDLTFNKVAFSAIPNDFDSVPRYDMQILPAPLMERGFYGDIVEYTHKVDVPLLDVLSSDLEQWYFRVYVQDDQNPVTEIPTDNGIFYIKSYCSFRYVE